MGEPAIRTEQADRADEDVAVDRDDPPQRVGVEERARDERRETARTQMPKNRESERKAAEIRERRCRADARDAPIEAIHEKQHRDDVHQIDEDLRDEREPHALAAEQITQHDVIAERERRGPDARVTVRARGALHGSAAAQRDERVTNDRHLQHQHRRADRESEQQRAQHALAQGVVVTRAERLRHESRRTHAQKAEAPEHEAEDEPAERDAAEILRPVEMPGDSRVDGAENRLREIRENDGKGQHHHAPVPVHGQRGGIG